MEKSLVNNDIVVSHRIICVSVHHHTTTLNRDELGLNLKRKERERRGKEEKKRQERKKNKKRQKKKKREKEK